SSEINVDSPLLPVHLPLLIGVCDNRSLYVLLGSLLAIGLSTSPEPPSTFFAGISPLLFTLNKSSAFLSFNNLPAGKRDAPAMTLATVELSESLNVLISSRIKKSAVDLATFRAPSPTSLTVSRNPLSSSSTGFNRLSGISETNL